MPEAVAVDRRKMRFTIEKIMIRRLKGEIRRLLLPRAATGGDCKYVWQASELLDVIAYGGLTGEARQQCAGHLPFERQATANGGFPILPTGTTDPYA